MKEFLKELVVLGTAIGTVVAKEIIAILVRHIKTPKEVKIKRKEFKHKKALAKIGKHKELIEYWNNELKLLNRTKQVKPIFNLTEERKELVKNEVTIQETKKESEPW